jgi:hypothetical protein
MRRFLGVLPITVLALAVFTTPAGAQEKKSRGTLINMTADSITVKVATTEIKFAVDSSTHVEAPGGATKTRAAAAAGQPGAKLSDILKVGDAVEVSYTETGGRHATEIRKVSSPGSGGVPAKMSEGVVTAVTSSSLSISGSSGGGGKFTQTFVIDDKTKVQAKGASTALAASGGKGPVTSLVATGDHVSVSFDESAGTLHATDIRVTMKAK